MDMEYIHFQINLGMKVDLLKINLKIYKLLLKSQIKEIGKIILCKVKEKCSIIRELYMKV